MAEITLPATVGDFVAATNAHDADVLFAVFAAGATVTDDGTTYDTEPALREWIKVHQVDQRIVITPISWQGTRLVASVDGEFPGGPLRFAFTFTEQDGTLTGLSIEPA
ncbi:MULTISPECIES: hypothetical protein [unclassified Arthrobacter]|uniref:hypothetical protein n=1 Tax=Arthrobacter sp. N1 TaxID=619291 RepID=UPI003BAEC3CF